MNTASAPPVDGLDPDVIRRACRDGDNIDWFTWTATGVYAATGISFVAYGAVYQTPAGTQTPVGISYLRGIGPGLILGAIGVPIARGVFNMGDPLRSVCATMERNGQQHRDNDYDTYAADRVLRVVGAPPSFVLPLLIGLATAACIGLSIVPFAINDQSIAGPAGGISAAAVAAWVVIPPTTRQSAARHYATGGYAAGSHARAPSPTMWAITPMPMQNAAGVGLTATF